MLAVVAATATFGLTGAGGSAQAEAPGPNGRIAFARFDPALGDTVTYTANPDGSDQQQLFFSGPSGAPRWSPDGAHVSIAAACTDGTQTCAATIVDPDSGTFRQLKWPDPTLETDCGVWSADGQQLACESFGVADPSRNGIYTIRTSDGGGLTRITSNPDGDDNPGDYSPNGKRMVFLRSTESGSVGVFVVKLNGSGLRQITSPGFVIDGEQNPSWSPTGNKILFTNRSAPDHRRAIWVVNADGSGLHQLPITPACGGPFSDPESIACFQPRWSPGGRRIVFTRTSANGSQEDIYTVNADGSGLARVTTSGVASQPDWGTHPVSN